MADFETRDEAAAALAAFTTAIDAEIDAADMPVELLQEFLGLRAAAVRDVQLRGERLLRRTLVQPLAVEPALVTAYRVYIDADRAEELVARNHVRHPAFVPALPLEVLQ